jgi:hypothetical protein
MVISTRMTLLVILMAYSVKASLVVRDWESLVSRARRPFLHRPLKD